MSAAPPTPPGLPPPKRRRIGLALSGGGFRASIFHLGVIRRLEELGIMADVDVCSAVSGGSIIAAYYVCEMEQQLRLQPPSDWRDRDARLRAFKVVAMKFLEKVQLNMRSRALVFTPFYHPWLFLKSLLLRPFRSHARSVLIQAEYDKHFYDGHTLDQLPAVTPERVRTTSGSLDRVLTGPQLCLNTTSLMTGERKAFSRDANSYLAELKTSNRNVLRLSQIVGASSGVPVLFPPTAVCGELLVDGGVSDNQGIEGLLPARKAAPKCGERPEAGTEPNLYLLISDASGQLELKHTLSTSSVSVFSRVNSILQHQVRNKLLDLLVQGYEAKAFKFAFIHLLLNLKDDGRIQNRVPSELIEPLARLRTDLDQFSLVEIEALMYHGYTLIDAMLTRWCTSLVPPDPLPLRTPPLFSHAVQQDSKKRDRIYKELLAGSENVFLLRAALKYRWRTCWVFIPVGFTLIAALLVLLAFPWQLAEPIVRFFLPLPTSLVSTLDALAAWLGSHHWVEAQNLTLNGALLLQDFSRMVVQLATFFGLVFLPCYLAAFWAWARLRHLALKWDKEAYRAMTGENEFSLDWRDSELPPQ